jgi:hypothetical protein
MMKRYIRSDIDSKPVRTLEISLEVYAFVNELAVTASEETYDLPIADKKIAEDVAIEYEEIISAVHGVLNGQGFTMLDYHKSNQSNSLYFIFCRETELEIEQVTLIIGMRVSDHDLPKWGGEKTDKEARLRMNRKLQEFANENKDVLNDSLSDDEYIDTAMVYVKYEHEFYSTYGDMLSKIRQKIKDFKRKFK